MPTTTASNLPIRSIASLWAQERGISEAAVENELMEAVGNNYGRTYFGRFHLQREIYKSRQSWKNSRGTPPSDENCDRAIMSAWGGLHTLSPLPYLGPETLIPRLAFEIWRESCGKQMPRFWKHLSHPDPLFRLKNEVLPIIEASGNCWTRVEVLGMARKRDIRSTTGAPLSDRSRPFEAFWKLVPETNKHGGRPPKRVRGNSWC